MQCSGKMPHLSKLKFVAARMAEDDQAKRRKGENCNQLRE